MSLPVIESLNEHLTQRYGGSLIFEETDTPKQLFIHGVNTNNNKEIWFLKILESKGHLVLVQNSFLDSQCLTLKTKHLLKDHLIQIDLIDPKAFKILQYVIKLVHKLYRSYMKNRHVKIKKLQYC